jgi:hypothetical protein
MMVEMVEIFGIGMGLSLFLLVLLASWWLLDDEDW